MIVAETERLIVRRMRLKDAQFVIDILNSPGWLQNIGDRKVHTLSDAEKYLKNKVLPDYGKSGFGMYLSEAKEDGRYIGMTGLVDRDGLEGIDVGFALLTEEMNKGFAFEGTKPLIDHAKSFGIELLKGITLPSNTPSRKLLEKLGFTFVKEFYLKDDPDLLCLYEMAL